MWIAVVLVTAVLGAEADRRLIEAVKRDDRAAVAALLAERVDVNSADADGSTALHGADANAADAHGVSPLTLACTNGSAALVTTLLGAGAHPNAATWSGETVLMTCARTGSVEAVEALLAAGADVNAAEPEANQTAPM